MSKQPIRKQYDIVIVGGGISGVCAAMAAARHGASTALVHNRPVLGGNASSEIRMHICGADCHGKRPNARETGILEEILLENKNRNPQWSFSIFDTILWEKCHFEKNLDLYLNTHMTEVTVEDKVIKKIKAIQLTTEKIFELEASLFTDATGDGTLAYLAGAEYMSGREGRDVFDETHAPEQSDQVTMGNTLLFRAIDTGNPVPFQKPYWANTYNEEELKLRDHGEITYGYWWIELGGEELHTVSDGEEIRDELLKALYGVWDHIKNKGDHKADNYVLDWVGFLPGKRESRRIKGDYILKEQDLIGGRIFDDAIAYGGWPMDMHVAGGLRAKLEPTDYIHLDKLYTIPYKSLYAKDIHNLMLAGRIISASHMAFGSTRVMGTCAVIGQAAGTAGALAIAKGIRPSAVSTHISELQQLLLRDDCYIPGLNNEDKRDLASKALIHCSSAVENGRCNHVINGISRSTPDSTNCWISEEITDEGAWLSLTFPEPIQLSALHIKFDSDLSREISISMSERVQKHQIPGPPTTLVKNYQLIFYKEDKQVYSEQIIDNYLRFKVHQLHAPIVCDKIMVKVTETYGDSHARVYEVRVY